MGLSGLSRCFIVNSQERYKHSNLNCYSYDKSKFIKISNLSTELAIKIARFPRKPDGGCLDYHTKKVKTKQYMMNSQHTKTFIEFVTVCLQQPQ